MRRDGRFWGWIRSPFYSVSLCHLWIRSPFYSVSLCHLWIKADSGRCYAACTHPAAEHYSINPPVRTTSHDIPPADERCRECEALDQKRKREQKA